MMTDSLAALRGTPTFFRMNSEARADVDARRSALFAQLTTLNTAYATDGPRLVGHFDAAVAAREKVREAFAKAAQTVQETQVAETDARLLYQAFERGLRQQLTQLADPTIAAAIERVDQLVDDVRRHDTTLERRDAADARLLALRASRNDLEQLLIVADIDAAQRVSVILARPEFQ